MQEESTQSDLEFERVCRTLFVLLIIGCAVLVRWAVINDNQRKSALAQTEIQDKADFERLTGISPDIAKRAKGSYTKDRDDEWIKANKIIHAKLLRMARELAVDQGGLEKMIPTDNGDTFSKQIQDVKNEKEKMRTKTDEFHKLIHVVARVTPYHEYRSVDEQLESKSRIYWSDVVEEIRCIFLLIPHS